MPDKCILCPLPKMIVTKVLLWFLLNVNLSKQTGSDVESVEWDHNGYVMYCPCMGRFGNQFEQFLGVLRFTKQLNRTLVVPPFVAYDYKSGTGFTPYASWFAIGELHKYHRVIAMDKFMKDLAPDHWPDDGVSRKVYCPSGAVERSPDKKSCPAKIGNPFGPFWDSSNIEFTGGSEVFDYGRLWGFNAQKWSEKYPPSTHPVIAFMGAPASFPISEADRGLQKYVKFSTVIQDAAVNFITSHLKRPYIGIHLRNGMDWVRSCEHVDESISYDFMGSPQCCGYGSKNKIQLTKEMCLPSKESVLEKVKEVASLHNASHLFVATDKNPMLDELKETSLKVVTYPENYPTMDLALLTMSDAFIGNCVSTFTSFVIRDREVRGKRNYFFAFDQTHPKIFHEEL